MERLPIIASMLGKRRAEGCVVRSGYTSRGPATPTQALSARYADRRSTGSVSRSSTSALSSSMSLSGTSRKARFTAAAKPRLRGIVTGLRALDRLRHRSRNSTVPSVDALATTTSGVPRRSATATWPEKWLCRSVSDSWVTIARPGGRGVGLPAGRVTVIPVVLLVLREAGDDQTRRALGEPAERSLDRPGLVPSAPGKPDAHDHRVDVRDELQWINRGEHRTGVDDDQVVGLGHRFEEVPAPVGGKQLGGLTGRPTRCDADQRRPRGRALPSRAVRGPVTTHAELMGLQDVLRRGAAAEIVRK